jgi:neutral ceramidase
MLMCGVGRADITPPVGTPMGGFANREWPCQGVLDPLSARALLLAQGEAVALLITLDTLALPNVLAARFCEEAARACAVPIRPADVRIACSHTHSGGDLTAMLGHDGSLGAYAEQVRAAIVEASRQASAALAPAVVSHGATKLPIGKNRRFRPGHAHPTELERAQGFEIDHTLTALRLAHAQTGQPLATVFHHACHAVCLGPENVLASGDYAGIAAQLVEQASGAPALFLNGACGNVTPIIGRGSTYSATRELARTVADAVVDLARNSSAGTASLASADPITAELPLGCYYKSEEEIDAAAERLTSLVTGFTPWATFVDGWRRRMLAHLRAGTLPRSVAAQVSALRIGDVRFAFTSAEVFNEYQMWQPLGVRVVGYTNGSACYIPTAAALAGGGYEVESAPIIFGLPCAPGPAAEPALLAAITNRVTQTIQRAIST